MSLGGEHLLRHGDHVAAWQLALRTQQRNRPQALRAYLD